MLSLIFNDIMMSCPLSLIQGDPNMITEIAEHQEEFPVARFFLLLTMAPLKTQNFGFVSAARFVRLLSLPPAPNDPITAGNLSTHQLTKGSCQKIPSTFAKAMLQAAQALQNFGIVADELGKFAGFADTKSLGDDWKCEIYSFYTGWRCGTW